MVKNKVITVFGATGKVGRLFTKIALQQGYFLRILVRNKSKGNIVSSDQLEVLEGNVTTLEDVKRVITGANVLVSFLGNTNRNTLIMEKATENIFRVARSLENPPRCLMISSVGVGGSSWFIKLLLTLIIGPATFADYEKAEALIRNEKKVPYLVVRPYALTNKLGKGQYQLIPGKTAHFAKPIARADVAKFFLDRIEDTSKDGTCVNIGGK